MSVCVGVIVGVDFAHERSVGGKILTAIVRHVENSSELRTGFVRLLHEILHSKQVTLKLEGEFVCALRA